MDSQYSCQNSLAGQGDVHYVSHENILSDSSVLTTFNSRAIESNLQRMPGVPKNHIYFNDDVSL